MPEGRLPQVWSGSISFGLVNVPVALVPSIRPVDFRFRELHRDDLAPVERRRFCLQEEVEVDRDEIGRGYDLGDGRIVTLTDEELEAAAPERTRTIEIESFTDPDRLDPIQFDRSYFAVPTGKGEGDRRAYRLLVEAMAAEGHAGIGRFVLRTKEYLVAIRARDSVLSLTTLLFANEVRDPGDVPVGDSEPSSRTVDEAVAVIEELSTEWDPATYEDCYRERLGRVIAEKRKGREVRAPEPVEAPQGSETAAPDLMSALKRTLEDVRTAEHPKQGRRSRPKPDRSRKQTRDELYRRAREAGIEGRSKMTKEELRAALDR